MQILKFLVAGGAGVLMYYIALYGLTEFVGVWYISSAIVAWALNWGCNFLLQKFWTFQDKNTQAVPRQLTQYFAMAISFLVLNTILLYALVEYLHLWYLPAQIILTAIFSVVSFLISRRIFTRQTTTERRSDGS